LTIPYPTGSLTLQEAPSFTWRTRRQIGSLYDRKEIGNKEVIARVIHEKSRRQNGPFIAVNCAALADSLIESEFFGHVKGAINDRLGRFQLAQGGTLFLDEIGDLSAKGQGDLLRVIEDGIFRPIGSPKLVRANARIIAAASPSSAVRLGGEKIFGGERVNDFFASEGSFV
jgi:transcriptional regulator with AAA-type ATPase domain